MKMKTCLPLLLLGGLVWIALWFRMSGTATNEIAEGAAPTGAVAESAAVPPTGSPPSGNDPAAAGAPATPTAPTVVDWQPEDPRAVMMREALTVSRGTARRIGDDLYERVRVVQVPEDVFKHPYVRTVERLRATDLEFMRDPELRWLGDERLVEAYEEVADHVVVRTLRGVSEDLLREALEGTGLTVFQALDTPGTYILQMPYHSINAVPNGLSLARTLEGVVASAQPNTIFHLSRTFPNDFIEELWGLHNDGEHDSDIDAPEAWSITTGTRDVIVAVIDTGVDYRHADLAANMWVNPDPTAPDRHGYDFYNRDPDPLDDHGHGTHCAGTIGAVGNNGLGIVGVNWEVRIMALKFLSRVGSGTLADGIDAVNYATTHGAHITNNSWGARTDPNREGDLLREAFANQLAAGIGVVAAAGNSFQDNAVNPQIPAAYPLYEQGLISVAASDRNDQLAIFSNFGATSVDLAAPGVAIYSTLLENTYGNSSGTSMAGPHVAGAYALLLDLFPALTPADARRILMESADPRPAFAGKVRSGGRLNAHQAVLRVGSVPLVFAETRATTETNGDGIVSPGETVTYTVGARNVSFVATSENVTVTPTITAGGGFATLTTGTMNFGTLEPRASSATGHPLSVALAPDTPTPFTFTVELLVADADGNTWTQSFDQNVYTITSIAGTVRLDGAPLAGATVRHRGTRTGTVTTATDGTYLISGLIDGDYEVRAESSGAYETAWTPVSLLPDAVGIDFDFTTVSIAGQVRQSGGAPIPGATVHYSGALSGSAPTGADGLYAISRVMGRSGNLTLRASVPGGIDSASRTLAMNPPTTRAGEDFVFEPVVISGIVRDAASQEPVEGATVTLSQAANGSLTTGPDGLFSFSAPAGRTATVRVEAFKTDTYRPAHVLRTVPPSQTDIVLDLESGWYQGFAIPNVHTTMPVEGGNTLMRPYLYGINENIEVVAQGNFGPSNLMMGGLLYRHAEGEWDVVHDKLAKPLSSLRGINDFGDASGWWNPIATGDGIWHMFGYLNNTVYNPNQAAFGAFVIDNDGRIYGLTYTGQMFIFEAGRPLRTPINSPHTTVRINPEAINRHGQLLFETIYRGTPDERIWAIGTVAEIEAGTYKIIKRDPRNNRDTWYFTRISHNGDALGFNFVNQVGGGVERREMWIYRAETDSLEQLPWPEWATNLHADFAHDFNASFEVVGTNTGAGVVGTPWIYRDGTFTDIRELVPVTDPLHTQIFHPTLINDDGVVAGLRWTGSEPAMFILIPPPEVRAGCLQFAGLRPEVREDAGTLTLTVRRVNGIKGAVSVDYRTVNETAEAGLDFLATSGTLHWEAGDDGERTIEITILDDEIVEGRETFLVELFNPTGEAVTAFGSTARVTILDTDLPDHLVAHWRMDAAAGTSVAIPPSMGTTALSLALPNGSPASSTTASASPRATACRSARASFVRRRARS